MQFTQIRSTIQRVAQAKNSGLGLQSAPEFAASFKALTGLDILPHGYETQEEFMTSKSEFSLSCTLNTLCIIEFTESFPLPIMTAPAHLADAVSNISKEFTGGERCDYLKAQSARLESIFDVAKNVLGIEMSDEDIVNKYLATVDHDERRRHMTSLVDLVPMDLRTDAIKQAMIEEVAQDAVNSLK